MHEPSTLPAERAAARPPHPAPTESGGTGLDDPRALQILSTEHWSLLATRSMSWNRDWTKTFAPYWTRTTPRTKSYLSSIVRTIRPLI